MMSKRAIAWKLILSLSLTALGACGDDDTYRDPMAGDGDGVEDGADGTDLDDAGPDDGADMGHVDAGDDAGELDAGEDAGDEDAGEPDAGEADGGVQGPIEIEGRWHSSFGGTEVIDSARWVSFAVQTVIAYDNEDNFVITQNPADDPWNPSKFNKVVWTEIAFGAFYVCTVDYGLDTAEAARASTKVADATNPEAGGCDTFPWTKLAETIEIEGRWHSSFGGTETIDSDGWTNYGTSTVIEYDNTDNYVITQNPADDMWNPSKYSKIVWTEIDGDRFYYCTVEYGRDTAEEARDTTNTADPTSPESGGCGQFAWTRLEAPIELEGEWLEGTTALRISSDAWGDKAIARYDNGANAAILQNPNGGDAPLEFSKVVWTYADEMPYVCTVSRGDDTAALAESNAIVADASDLMLGCGGSAWSQLDVAP